MKTMIIGDIHGHDSWKELTKNALSESCYIVFVGDYVDSFTIKPYAILQNFKNIIDFKKKHHDKTTLLLGNHDYAYIYENLNISGFNAAMKYDYADIINDNWELFDIAWGHKNKETNKYTLVTHAGLTSSYFKKVLLPELKNPNTSIGNFIKHTKHYDEYEYHELLNLFKGKQDILWVVSEKRGGHWKTGSVIWADYNDVIKDPIKGIDQVFGHTPQIAPFIRYNGDDMQICVDSMHRLGSIILDI